MSLTLAASEHSLTTFSTIIGSDGPHTRSYLHRTLITGWLINGGELRCPRPPPPHEKLTRSRDLIIDGDGDLDRGPPTQLPRLRKETRNGRPSTTLIYRWPETVKWDCSGRKLSWVLRRDTPILSSLIIDPHVGVPTPNFNPTKNQFFFIRVTTYIGAIFKIYKGLKKSI